VHANTTWESLLVSTLIFRIKGKLTFKIVVLFDLASSLLLGFLRFSMYLVLSRACYHAMLIYREQLLN